MTPDDPRHGTPNGYINGRCREACCRGAATARKAEYRKIRYCYGPLTVPCLGSVRRLQALAAIGWSGREIGRRIGSSESDVLRWRAGYYPTIHVTTDKAIREVFAALCMITPPATSSTVNVRNRARRLGWFPPLAYDDIDDPDELPPWDVYYRAAS